MDNYKDKFAQETHFTIDYGDLDEIIQEEYNCPNFTSCLGQSNDSRLTFHIDGNLNRFDEEELQEFLRDHDQDEYGTTRLLMNDLCRKGKIESGHYLISISW